MIFEIISAVYGAIAISVGLYELYRAYKNYDKLSEEKFRKINVPHLVMPGVLLIGIGSLVLCFNLMIRITEINRDADVAIAAHGKNSKKSEGEKAAEERCGSTKETAKQTVPSNCIGNLIYQGEKK